jgi:carboxyl-terminal processing protease
MATVKTMTRGRILFFALSALLILPVLTATLLSAADRNQEPEEDSFYKYLAVFTEALGLVRQAYVDEPDMDMLLSGALDGTTDALDPFSLYVPASAVNAYRETAAVGQRHSGLTVLKERGIAYVVAVERGSPGDAGGVKPGDIVSQIDARSTRLMPLWEMQGLLARPAGTKVDMELIRVGETRQASFTLAPYAAPAVAAGQVEGVVKLDIPTFDAATAPAVERLLTEWAGKAGGKLLIDLRGASGGDPEAAYEAARLFTSGALGALKRRSEEVKSFTATGTVGFKGRIVVLVDRSTLGAAEVFATVLRQKEKAELVGERTFGHAGRQGSAELSSGGRLLFTDAFFTGPDQTPLNESLKPDLLVDERSRTFLEKDVPIDELILRRGVRRLLGEEAPAEAKAA